MNDLKRQASNISQFTQLSRNKGFISILPGCT